MQTQTEKRIFLQQRDMPRNWYNILPDLPGPLQPPLHPVTREPVNPSDLEPLFAPALIEQEMAADREIPIPDEILEKLAMYRPSPLVRARNLERALDTPARIYFKNEGYSPPGSHKPNSAIPQAYYIRQCGAARVVTETGAGQWGSALAFAAGMFGLDCTVYMVRTSYDQKPYRRTLIETWGGRCIPSPSPTTECGRRFLAADPDTPGSLGMAISEAVEIAVADPGTKYSLGSVLNHVLMHQTVIGLEARKQMDYLGEYPDVVVGCVGGGSNFAGLALPFVREKLDGRATRFVAVEPASCPTLTRGPYGYDYGDSSGTTPLMPMHSLGHDFVPRPIHAGGLRYHGMAPVVSALVESGVVEPLAVNQLESFAAGLLFARTEGYLPAPETCHAIAGVIREAEQARDAKQPVTILFSWSGHGLIDLSAYAAYLGGTLVDHQLPETEIDRAVKTLSAFPKPQ